MSYEEEFDKIVRQKAEEAEYPFDAGNWEKARGMMDAERSGAAQLARKKLYMPIASVIGVVAIGITAYLYFVPSSSPELSQVNSQNLPTTIKTGSEQNNVPPITNENNVLDKQETPAAIVAGREEDLKKADQGTSQQAQSAILSSGSTSEAKENTVQTKSAAKTVETDTKEQTAIATQNASLPNTAEAKEEPVPTEKGNESSKAEQMVAGVVVSKLIPTPSKNENTISKPEENKTAVEADATAMAGSNQESESLAAIELHLHQGSIPNEKVDRDIKALPFILLKRYDDEYYTEKLKTHTLNAELGGTYLFGWNTANGKDGDGINAFAGLNYRYYLNKKVSFGAGLQAYTISHITEPFYSNSQKEYGFGSSTTHTVITSTDLLFVSVPLRFAYDISRTHRVGLGLNAGYLVSSKNTVSTYELNEGVKSADESKKTTGVYDGINRNNLVAGMFYTARLGNRLALNSEFTYGLTDIFKNFGDINNAESSMGISLSLQYTLFDK